MGFVGAVGTFDVSLTHMTKVIIITCTYIRTRNMVNDKNLHVGVYVGDDDIMGITILSVTSYSTSLTPVNVAVYVYCAFGVSPLKVMLTPQTALPIKSPGVNVILYMALSIVLIQLIVIELSIVLELHLNSTILYITH